METVSTHSTRLSWRSDGHFSHTGYNKDHQLDVGNDVVIPAAAANNDMGTDPEKLLAASLASCHMLTFLALAAKKRLVVESYDDQPVAELVKRDDGKFAVATIRLNPTVVFSGDKQPDEAAVVAMHHKAHDHCFIANSIDCDVVVEPVF